jgi:hypothetical protein
MSEKKKKKKAKKKKNLAIIKTSVHTFDSRWIHTDRGHTSRGTNNGDDCVAEIFFFPKKLANFSIGLKNHTNRCNINLYLSRTWRLGREEARGQQRHRGSRKQADVRRHHPCLLLVHHGTRKARGRAHKSKSRHSLLYVLSGGATLTQTKTQMSKMIDL